MNKLTAKEIIDQLQYAGWEVEEFAYASSSEDTYCAPSGESDWDRIKEGLNLQFKEIEQYGGEGKGEDWWSVKYFPHHDIYIKVEGWYQSYHGTEFGDGWDCCKGVSPKQKTITIFE